eukprot:scaffold988_cov105-Isochrysis_galbana.AAC.6
MVSEAQATPGSCIPRAAFRPRVLFSPETPIPPEAPVPPRDPLTPCCRAVEAQLASTLPRADRQRSR